jgi:hypothetical protein
MPPPKCRANTTNIKFVYGLYKRRSHWQPNRIYDLNAAVTIARQCQWHPTASVSVFNSFFIETLLHSISFISGVNGSLAVDFLTPQSRKIWWPAKLKSYFTYLRTQLSPSWEAANCAAIQKIPSNLKEPEGSSPCSQEPSIGPYPELVHQTKILSYIYLF